VGLLDWLSGKSDPTKGWVRDPALKLTLDFRLGALCAVTLGEPAERLAILGPAEDRRAALEGDLHYFTLGLGVGVSGGGIESVTLWWRDYLDRGYRAYAGTVVSDGKNLGLGPATTEAELLSVLGQPYWRDRDDSETILFYEVKDAWGRLTERQVELDEEGRLKALLVLSQPILADENQRIAYRIDKAWPP
jgi:hypothetical protein